MEDFSQKIENLKTSNRTVKRIARKASRQAMNVVRDAARSNAKMIDAGLHQRTNLENIVTQGGKSRNSNEVKFRVGVKTGPEFWRMNKGMFRKQGGNTVRLKSPILHLHP